MALYCRAPLILGLSIRKRGHLFEVAVRTGRRTRHVPRSSISITTVATIWKVELEMYAFRKIDVYCRC